MSSQVYVYNLEFPPYVDELRIGDYVFHRVERYEEACQGLMHLVHSSGSEFNTVVQTGSHQITAVVDTPNVETNCVLPWATLLKQLDDILFLLTLFTGRNVFKHEKDDNDEHALLVDPRMHHYGGQLILSIKYESAWKHRKTGHIRNRDDIEGIPAFDYDQINTGFEISINEILNTISSRRWQVEYEGGYFLFLFRAAIQRQIIESSFLLCWTIGEHLFAIHHRKKLSASDIVNTGGEKKVGFILEKYLLKKLDGDARANIRRINAARNRLVHYGKKTEDIDSDDMDLFIRLTEQVMAIVLELAPSNAFNSFERLDTFLEVK